MPTRKSSLCILALLAATAYAQTKPPLVDLEMMTWPELKAAIDQGKTTALVYNGGTETRGPQNVNGGHTLMAHATVIAIAEKLGNAIAAPVLPFSPNSANANLPGTIGLTAPVFAAILKLLDAYQEAVVALPGERRTLTFLILAATVARTPDVPVPGDL